MFLFLVSIYKCLFINNKKIMIKKIQKLSLVGFLALGMMLVASPANAAITLGALTAASDGALTITTAVGSAGNLFTTTTTGAINIGTSATTGSITIGGAQTSGAISIGGGVQTGTITLGGGTGAQTVNLGTGGTGIKTINIGTGAVANVITIGTETGAASLELMYGTGALKVSPTPNTTIVQDELSMHLVSLDGGAPTEAETFSGLRTSAVVVCSPISVTNAVNWQEAVVTADTITFTFSGDPGASTVGCMIHNI